MDRIEYLSRRVAALSLMKTALANKSGIIEMNVVRRGYTDPDEASLYCDNLASIRTLDKEIERTLKDYANFIGTKYGTEEVKFYDDTLRNLVSLDELVDEAGAKALEVQRCSGIGERIKTLKDRLGLTTKELSLLSGISRDTLSRYQSGKIKSVSVVYIEKLAKALQVAPGVIAGWDIM